MNHEETIKRIQELVPSVMELKEGCWIQRNGTRENPQNILYKVLENRGIMTGISINDTSYNKLICYDYTFETLKTFRSENEKENPIENSTILGRPITLEDVLIAIEQKGYYNNTTMTMYIGGLVDWIDEDNNFLWNWQLNKSFNDQSEETKTFIGELLK